MNTHKISMKKIQLPRLSQLPVSARALVTATILILGIALLGALGQVILHDIIPTFYQPDSKSDLEVKEKTDEAIALKEINGNQTGRRGDLFSDLPSMEKAEPAKPFYEESQFVWLLKWTHIHLFGMNMIFIFMGAIALFLNVGDRSKFWIVLLPFFGVLVDISALWLKTYVSPVFFWLHIPGGGLFAVIYGFISIRAWTEMWTNPIKTGV